ncbi:asparagine synthase-related protein [Microbispora sp. ZYX-F-249]|uniref:Asparagine synthase-related protein n=1 Tax=Microbispora maris TaxID=3144104 RepID=A0ABV0AIQ3_9ACTN
MEFVVLPDSPAANEIEDLLPASLREKVLRHPSGRPWLVGRWRDADVVLAESPHGGIALLGTSAVAEEDLSDRLRRLRTVRDLDALSRSISGSFHLIGSVGGQVRAQGTISTARQIFYGTVLGVTVAADRPQTIAQLTSAWIDEERLALHLLTPFGAPWPLSENSLWKGVRALRPGCYLRMTSDGAGNVEPWWAPPAPEVSLADGAGMVRDALRAAVAARSHRAETISSDFSGGMDSTALCFLAAANPGRLVTVHYEAAGDLNDDKVWADRCRAELPHAEHVVLSRGTGPALYAPLSTARLDLEGPVPLARPRARLEHVLKLVADMGSTRHMQGSGGDELFHTTTTGVYTMSRQTPWRSLRHIRSARARYRWSPSDTIRRFSTMKPYPRWLAWNADQIDDQRLWGDETGWEIVPRMPPWATEDAVRTARRLLYELAEEQPAPFSALPVQHEMVRSVQATGWNIRGVSRMAEQFGVSLEAPYLDDLVLDAALSVRLEDRLSTARAKPVLAAAMRGLVPYVLDRQTKGDGSAEFYEGLRMHRQRLWEICGDSHLARMGLIDPGGLRSVLFEEHADARPFMPFDTTLGVELWLRSLSGEAIG